MFAGGRTTCGIILRGATCPGTAGGAAATTTGATIETFGTTGVADTGTCAGVATTAGGRGGGIDRAVASACLRSRIAFNASPGFETFDRSNFGAAATTGLLTVLVRLPPLK